MLGVLCCWKEYCRSNSLIKEKYITLVIGEQLKSIFWKYSFIVTWVEVNPNSILVFGCYMLHNHPHLEWNKDNRNEYIKQTTLCCYCCILFFGHCHGNFIFSNNLVFIVSLSFSGRCSLSLSLSLVVVVVNC